VSHEWGNYPENFTPKMYWGARAILERESNGPGKILCLLPDRQSFERLDGSRMAADSFIDWINKKVLRRWFCGLPRELERSVSSFPLPNL